MIWGVCVTVSDMGSNVTILDDMKETMDALNETLIKLGVDLVGTLEKDIKQIF